MWVGEKNLKEREYMDGPDMGGGDIIKINLQEIMWTVFFGIVIGIVRKLL